MYYWEWVSHGHTEVQAMKQGERTSHRCYWMLLLVAVCYSILSLPYAFQQAGWLVGAIGLSLMALLGYLTMTHIINCVHLTRARMRRHKAGGGSLVKYGSVAPPTLSSSSSVDGFSDPSPSPSPSIEVAEVERTIEADPDLETIGYQQVAGICFGHRGKILVDVVLIFAQLGCGTAFISLVLTSVQAVIMSCGWKIELVYVGAVVFPLVLLLALPRTTTYLAPAAHMGNITLLICVATLVYYGLTASDSHFVFDLATLRNLPYYSGHWQGILIFCGICAFSFAAHAEIVAVESDSYSREVYQGYILPFSIVVIGLLYISVGTFAYACFLSHTHPNILLNLGGAFGVNLVRMAMSLTLVVNYALAVLPASQALDLLVLGKAPVATTPHQIEPNDERIREIMAKRERKEAGETTPLLAPRPLHPHSTSNPFGHITPPAPAGTFKDEKEEEEEENEEPNTASTTDSLWPLDQNEDTSSPATGLYSHANVHVNGNGNGNGVSHTSMSSSSPSPYATVRPPSAAMIAAQQDREKAIVWYHAKGNVIRTCMCILTFAIAIVVKDLGVLFSVVGSVAGGLLCFTLPPLLWYRLCELEGRPLTTFGKFTLVLQIMFGAALIAAGIIVIIESAHATYNEGISKAN